MEDASLKLPGNKGPSPTGKCAAAAASPDHPWQALLLAALLVTAPTVFATDDLSPLSDEFDSAATITQWSRINVVEGWHADQLESWSIDPAGEGTMTMVPYSSSWFEDWRGVFPNPGQSDDREPPPGLPPRS